MNEILGGHNFLIKGKLLLLYPERKRSIISYYIYYCNLGVPQK